MIEDKHLEAELEAMKELFNTEEFRKYEAAEAVIMKLPEYRKYHGLKYLRRSDDLDKNYEKWKNNISIYSSLSRSPAQIRCDYEMTLFSSRENKSQNFEEWSKERETQ